MTTPSVFPLFMLTKTGGVTEIITISDSVNATLTEEVMIATVVEDTLKASITDESYVSKISEGEEIVISDNQIIAELK
jgi:hypothetical protein